MLPDEESARIVTPSWLAAIRDEVARLLDPDIEGLQVSDVVDTTAVIEAVEKLVGALRHERREVERLAEVCRKWEAHFTDTPGIAAANAEIVSLRAQLAAMSDARNELESRLAGAEAANAAPDLVEHVELSGHIEIAEQCRDYLDHQAMDDGDPSGKLRDFSQSLSIVIDQLDRRRRRLNWFEVAHTAGKQKLVESAVDRALTAARAAARLYAHHVNQLGLAADDNDPKVMETAGPIGEAQWSLWEALGLAEQDEPKPCGFGLDGGDCYACQLGSGKAGAQ